MPLFFHMKKHHFCLMLKKVQYTIIFNKIKNNIGNKKLLNPLGCVTQVNSSFLFFSFLNWIFLFLFLFLSFNIELIGHCNLSMFVFYMVISSHDPSHIFNWLTRIYPHRYNILLSQYFYKKKISSNICKILNSWLFLFS